MSRAIGPESSNSDKPPAYEVGSGDIALLLLDLMGKGLTLPVEERDRKGEPGSRVIETDHDAADSQATGRLMGILQHVAGNGELDPFNRDLREFPILGASVMPEDDRRVFFSRPAERNPEFMRRLAAAATATMPLGKWSGKPSPEAVQRAERHREIGAAWRYRSYRGLGISEVPTRPLRPVEPPAATPGSGQNRPQAAEPPTELLSPVATPDAPTLLTAAIPGGLEYSTGAGVVRGILVEQPHKQE